MVIDTLDTPFFASKPWGSPAPRCPRQGASRVARVPTVWRPANKSTIAAGDRATVARGALRMEKAVFPAPRTPRTEESMGESFTRNTLARKERLK
jgi:hypothetical protein